MVLYFIQTIKKLFESSLILLIRIQIRQQIICATFVHFLKYRQTLIQKKVDNHLAKNFEKLEEILNQQTQSIHCRDCRINPS